MPKTNTKTRENLKLFTVSIQRDRSSQPITHKNAVNAFQKGDLYCVMIKHEDGTHSSVKYPISTLFRIIEDY